MIQPQHGRGASGFGVAPCKLVTGDSVGFGTGMQRMPESCDTLRILILNGDLPIFPGRAGHEYLHTIHLAARAQEVGLVSMVHNVEQYEKKQELVDAGVSL
jgi:hypothetical protein